MNAITILAICIFCETGLCDTTIHSIKAGPDRLDLISSADHPFWVKHETKGPAPLYFKVSRNSGTLTVLYGSTGAIYGTLAEGLSAQPQKLRKIESKADKWSIEFQAGVGEVNLIISGVTFKMSRQEALKLLNIIARHLEKGLDGTPPLK